MKAQNLKVMGLALSLPTTMLAVIWGVMDLADRGIFPRWVALVIIVSVLFNFFVMILWYAKRSREKSKVKKEMLLKINALKKKQGKL